MRTLDVLGICKRVIAYTITNPYELDYWEKAPAITGVMAWQNKDSTEAIRVWLERAIETQNSNGDLNYCHPLDLKSGHAKSFVPTSTLPASLGYPLLRMYRQIKDEAYLDAAKLQIAALMRTARTSEGGFWARAEGPELWIDFLYMMCPFLIEYAQVTGQQEFTDEAFKQYAVHVKHLVDPHFGLARHAWCETPNSYPQSTFWARGNGWLICVSLDMLEMAPDHPQADLVRTTFVRALEAMAAHQDRSGFLRHVLDDPNEKFEASGTLMFAYAAARGVRMKLLDEKYMDAAERALRVVAGSVEPNGAVPGVAVPPGGPGVPFGTTLFGQGFFLHAAHEMRDRLQTSGAQHVRSV